MELGIGKSWEKLLKNELKQDYFIDLSDTVRSAYLSGSVYPLQENVFNAFKLCPVNKVKVVILGQDPYHGVGQAHGLSFSVPDGIKTPPSLQNIYKEIKNDLGQEIPDSGNLEHWATQGALLLNATLTVEASKPGSHQSLGWEQFTDAIIKKTSDEREYVVFLLWGRYAQAKAGLIDNNKHLILIAPHPSPFSAYTGFFGCKHFSKTNLYLLQHGIVPIEW